MTSPGHLAASAGCWSVRVRLVVAYLGTGFHGFAPQPGVRTIGGTLAHALELVLGHRVELVCAGRTDAGVHAWGQVVSFDARAQGLDLDRLQRAVNRLCASAIVVRAAEIAAPDFDARRCARARRYRYTVLNRAVPDPFLALTACHVPEPLDVARMRLGCDPLLGEHDFTSFCRAPKRSGTYSMVRRITDLRWVDGGDGLLRFDVEASAFCHQMVRSIVGLLLDVGRGRRRAGEVAGILRARDRRAAVPVAPPHGLCFWEVVY